MPTVSLRELGRFGWVSDIPGHELPPEFFGEIENASVKDGAICPILGETQVEGTPTVAPFYLMPAPAENDFYWMYFSTTKAYAVLGGVHTDITRAAGDYTGTAFDKWNGGWLNGVMIVNNGVDVPQGWNPVEAGTPLVNLPNWPASTYAKVLRPFQEFMIAMDLTISGQRYKTRVRWSHPADPQSFPSSWDVSSTTNLAGEYSLSETGGEIVDGLALGNAFLVYKTDAVIRLDRVANSLVFTRRPVTTRVGLLSQNCVQEHQPGQHIFLSKNLDVMVTDGQRVESILEEKHRKYLRRNVAVDGYEKCFVAVNTEDNEVLIAYPEPGQAYCTRALVWNMGTGAWGDRQLTPTLDVKLGIFSPAAVARIWSAMTTTWSTEKSKWSDSSARQGVYKLLGAFPTVSKLAEVGSGNSLLSGAVETRLERRGLAIAGMDRLGKPKVNPHVVKLLTEMYPVFSEDSKGTIRITWGAQDTPTGAVTWGETFELLVTEIDRIHPDVEGKYLAVKFESSEGQTWYLQGYSMTVENVGGV